MPIPAITNGYNIANIMNYMYFSNLYRFDKISYRKMLLADNVKLLNSSVF